MSTSPLISIVMPMRNADRFVRASIESVLAQDVPLELIVIDDGSTDGSAAVVRAIGDPRVRLIPGPQRGISAAFNAGLAAAQGRYVARCDADDFYRPGRLIRQVAWLDAHPQSVAVAAGYSYLDADGRFGTEWINDDGLTDVTAELLNGVGRSHMCACLFRTDALRAIGGCREWFVTSEDADLQYRLAAHGPIGYEPFDAYGYRLHPSSITHTQRGREKRWYMAAAKHFLRQRTDTGADDLMRGTPPLVNAPLDSADAIGDGNTSLQDWIIARSWDLHRRGRRVQALRTGWRGVRLAPTSVRAWRNGLVLLLKGWTDAS